MTADLRAIAYRALAMSHAPLHRHIPGHELVEREGVWLLRTALPGFSRMTVFGAAATPERAFAMADDLFAGTVGGYSVMVDGGAGHPMEEALRARGWLVADDEPGMVLPAIGAAPPPPAGLGIRWVTDEASLRDFWGEGEPEEQAISPETGLPLRASGAILSAGVHGRHDAVTAAPSLQRTEVESMALVSRDDFDGLDGLAHLAAGGETPPLKTQVAALTRWAGLKGRGPDGAPVRTEALARLKERAAQLFGLSTGEIALASSAGEAMSQVALSVPIEPGDNVVVQDVEFRSASLPWVGLARRGVEVRVIKHADWTPDESAFCAAVDGRTRAIVTSQVNYLTGIQHNLEALRELADGAGAMLVVDATHAAGAVPVPARQCDFAITATYKWILGCQGVALLLWNRQRVPELAPAISGWRSADDWQGVGDPRKIEWKPGAERLEPGNPPWPSVFYFDEGLGYINATGISQISAHDMALSDEVNARLRHMELDVATPADPRYRAGNNCFWIANPEEVAERLFREHKVLVSGYSARIRISTHLYNDMDDVDRLFHALEKVLR